ncbi:heme biosynthesis protein HemY [Nitrosovibrio sp. Nv17]|uniref:heme biosynthesis protein HemY n=1 Tax=Nitrosovibrio sp. Nv17 TaxID=1855339 RepID=UPI000908F932|nr:hypothetical protein [Nitrosovibrio sp. Nv17]SFW28067.1 HemY protein [Nitrosovibrio sp. Nv17]
METAAPEEVFLRLVTQAELLLDQDRPEAALEAARTLRLRGNPADPALLRLELKAQQRLENWDAVLDLLSLLQRHDVLDETSIRRQRCHAHAQNLKNRPSIQAFREYWQALSPADRADGTVATAAVRTCVALSDCTTARRIIEQSLDKNWNSELAGLYGTCPDTDVLGQIERAEAWLPSHPGDAGLLLALGRLCTHCELWGKARSYLEASLSVEPGHSAHLALASLDERSGHPELAQHHYRQALEWALRRRAPDAGPPTPDEAGKARSG